MFCSIVIPTIGRETLSRAVCSILEQDFTVSDFEIIVVNDSGQSLPTKEWQRSDRIQVINTNRRERSVARNAGAAIARGKYLLFLDDDDCLLPGALESLWKLADTYEAALLYGGYKFVDSLGCLLEEWFPNESGNCFVRFMAGEWLPLQVSLIKSEAFFSVGGFASLESLLGGDEDVDLARQITLHHDIAGTSNLVAAIRVGSEGRTTNYTNLQDQSRKSREKALNAPGAYTRMRASALNRKIGASYWLGRIVWNYLTSVLWNLQRGQLFTAISRMLYAIAGSFMAGKHIFSPDFWRGATRPHIAKGWLYSEVSR